MCACVYVCVHYLAIMIYVLLGKLITSNINALYRLNSLNTKMLENEAYF